MAGSTTHGLPYPTGTDRVMDGDNAMQSLAEAVDTKALSDTGWVNLALDGTIFQAVGGYPLQYRKVNSRVEIHGAAKWASGAFFASVITNLPVGCRPPGSTSEWFCLTVAVPSRAAAQFVCYPSGNIACPSSGYTTANPVVNDIFYLFGSWFVN